MKRYSKNFILLLSCICMGMLLGCNDTNIDKKVNKKYNLGVVLKAMNSEHWFSVKAGIERAAKDLNVNVTILYPENETDIEIQKVLIRDMIDNEVDGIAISPCDSEDTIEYTIYAQAKKVLVYAIDTEMQTDTYFVGSNNREIGKMAADYFINELNFRGEIAVISGSHKQKSHKDRVEGFKDVIDKHDDIKIVYEGIADSSSIKAMEETEKILKKYPNISGIFTTNATMALGIIENESYKNNKNKMKIVCVDMQSDAIRGVINKKISGIVSQDGYAMGYKTIQNMVKLLKGKDANKHIYIESYIITPENAADFLNYNQGGS